MSNEEKWLKHVLGILDSDADFKAFFKDFMGAILGCEGLEEWWNAQKADAAIQERERRKAAALEKLTREERVLLGLERSMPSGVVTGLAGVSERNVYHTGSPCGAFNR